jgi:hypothetical protein
MLKHNLQLEAPLVHSRTSSGGTTLTCRRFALLVAFVLGGCSWLPTERNPDYCRSSDDCDPGSICNLESHGCEAPPDADPDATAARCDPKQAFGAPEPLSGVNTGANEKSFTMIDNELTAYIVRDNAGSFDVLTSKRQLATDDFPSPTPDSDLDRVLSGIGNEYDLWPARSSLLMYFGGQGKPYVAERSSTSMPFGDPAAVLIDGVHLTTMRSMQPSVDAQNLYWIDNGDAKLRVAANFFGSGSFRPASQVSTMELAAATVSADELTLIYVPSAVDDVYISTRQSKNQAFEPGALVPTLSGGTNELPLFLTRDQCVLYMAKMGAGSTDVWIAHRPR